MTRALPRVPMSRRLIIRDHLEARIDFWNPQAQAFNGAARAETHAAERTVGLCAEARQCARALTALVKPYTFAKTPNPYFEDNGNIVHASVPKKIDENLKTNIGAIDIWAAGLVDRDFAALCRDNIVVSPQVDEDQSPVADFDKYDSYFVKAGIVDTKTDTLVTDGVSAPFEKLHEARRVLGDKLSLAFTSLMENSETRTAIKATRTFFMTEYQLQLATAKNRTPVPIPSREKSDPSFVIFDRIKEDQRTLYALAYLDLTRVKRLTVPHTQMTEDALFDAAKRSERIGVPFIAGTYGNSPGYINPVVRPVLDAVLKKARMVMLEEPNLEVKEEDLPMRLDQESYVRKFIAKALDLSSG